MTVHSALALGASRTSSRPAGLIGSGSWHRFREPSVLLEHHGTVRGGQHSRPYPSPLRFYRCDARLECITTSAGLRPTASDSVPTRATEGFKSVLMSSPKSTKRLSKGAWCIHGRVSMIVREPLKPGLITYERKRATAAFRLTT